MNKANLIMMAMTCALASCSGGKESSQGEYIGKQKITIENGLMTPEVLEHG